jgi:hypothetical protein
LPLARSGICAALSGTLASAMTAVDFTKSAPSSQQPRPAEIRRSMSTRPQARGAPSFAMLDAVNTDSRDSVGEQRSESDAKKAAAARHLRLLGGVTRSYENRDVRSEEGHDIGALREASGRSGFRARSWAWTIAASPVLIAFGGAAETTTDRHV